MKTFLKILKWVGIVIVLLVSGVVVTIFARQGKTYDAPYPDITAKTDSATLARGEYLVYGPAHCSGCHSPIENFEAVKRGERVPLEGGFTFDLGIATIHTPNITPDEETGIGKFTDQEIARSLRYGVARDGHPLFDFMPFHNTSDEDLVAIISYLRTMPVVKKQIPEGTKTFFGKFVYAFFIKPVGPEEGVDIPKSITPDTTAKYGEYLANYVANCRGCHTNRDLQTGAYIGEFYSGGFAMPSMMEKGKAVVSRNLTPDPETGTIYGWSQQKFIDRIRQGRIVPISEMPWDQFQQMSDDDLKAIYAYLQTLKPVKKDAGTVVVDLPK